MQKQISILVLSFLLISCDTLLGARPQSGDFEVSFGTSTDLYAMTAVFYYYLHKKVEQGLESGYRVDQRVEKNVKYFQRAIVHSSSLLIREASSKEALGFLTWEVVDDYYGEIQHWIISQKGLNGLCAGLLFDKLERHLRKTLGIVRISMLRRQEAGIRFLKRRGYVNSGPDEADHNCDIYIKSLLA